MNVKEHMSDRNRTRQNVIRNVIGWPSTSDSDSLQVDRLLSISFLLQIYCIPFAVVW